MSTTTEWPPSQETLDRVVEKARAMTPEQLQQSFVDAGILNEDGMLTEPYLTDLTDFQKPAS
jgi:hypothetical protein